MKKRTIERPTGGSAEIFDRISDLSGQAEWTNEELDEALREGGVDPEHLVKAVFTDVKRFLNEAAAVFDRMPEAGQARLSGQVDVERASSPSDWDDRTLVWGGMSSLDTTGESLALLGMMKKVTGLSVGAIAKAMDVTVAFLSDVARYPKAIPVTWIDELAARSERAFNIRRQLFKETLAYPFPQGISPLGEESDITEEISYEGILNRSGMNAQAKQFWMRKAIEAPSE